MMNRHSSTFFFLFLFFSSNAPSTTHAGLFRRWRQKKLNRRVQRRCDFVLNRLGLGPVNLNDFVDCTCTAEREILRGRTTTITCEPSNIIDQTFCFSDLFCGTANASVVFNLRGDGLEEFQTCVETIRPEGAVIDTPDLCVTGLADPDRRLALEDCSIRISNNECQSCEVCRGGRAVKFNCSNVPLNPGGLVEIPGWSTTQCLGLNFFRNETDGDNGITNVWGIKPEGN